AVGVETDVAVSTTALSVANGVLRGVTIAAGVSDATTGVGVGLSASVGVVVGTVDEPGTVIGESVSMAVRLANGVGELATTGVVEVATADGLGEAGGSDAAKTSAGFSNWMTSATSTMAEF